MSERLLRVALLGSAWVLYVLLALSFVSISVMVERWLYFRKFRDDLGRLRHGVVNALLNGDDAKLDLLLQASPSVEAKVVSVGLSFREGGPQAVTDAMEAELERRKKDLERGNNVLGTLGNNAPFLGLFGTVLGVIEAFHHLGDTQNKGAMGNVMAAIAEALIATGVGLFVALPAVVAYNTIAAKVEALEASVASFRKFVTAALLVRERWTTHPSTSTTASEDSDPEVVLHHAANGLNGHAVQAASEV